MQENPVNKKEKPQDLSTLESLLFSNKSANWDSAIFLESYGVLLDELEECENEQAKKAKLIEFYRDAFLPEKRREFSEYEDRFSMSIPKINFPLSYDSEKVIADSGLVGSSIGHFLDGNKTFSRKSAEVTVAFYGPSKIYNVKAGDFIFVPNEELGENDLIGSEKFTGCTTVYVKVDKGVFFGHVTVGTCDIKEMTDKCRQLFGADVIIEIARPERRVDGQVDETQEDLWQSLQNEKNIKELKYPEIAYGVDKPEGVHDYSILLTRKGLKILENKL